MGRGAQGPVEAGYGAMEHKARWEGGKYSGLSEAPHA